MPELDLSSFPEALALFDGPISMVLGSSNVQKRPHFARAQGVRRGEAADLRRQLRDLVRAEAKDAQPRQAGEHGAV